MSSFSGDSSPSAFQQVAAQQQAQTIAKQDLEDEKTASDKAAADARAKSNRGRPSTILSGGQGLLDTPNVKTNTLLGF